MSTAEIRAKNQDIAVNVIHYLGDAFWRFSL
jgi:predicted ribosome-associated RNA-binding protein Tma20